LSLLLVLGGARSGKSALAARLAGAEATLIATGTAGDDDMAERIRRHREERPPGWTTVEEPVQLTGALAAAPPEGVVVVDCLTLWVSNLVAAGWEDDAVVAEAHRAAALAAARGALTVTVSNEVGLGIVPATPLGRRYRDLLGRVNAAWAAAAERVLLVVAGRTLELGASV
jgi:adenosyl cobinamide kinase/adenosyl cobinamide phosphate guanylyltransferase